MSTAASITAGIVAALVAAVLFVVGVALQQRGHLLQLEAQLTSGRLSRRAAAAAVMRQPVWILGQIAGSSGYVIHIVAVALAPLSVVQPPLALQIPMLVPAGAWVVGGRVERREWWLAAVVMAGLVAFLVLGRPGGGSAVAPLERWIPVVVLSAAAFAGLFAAAGRLPDYRAALLGTATGVWAAPTTALFRQATEGGDGSLLPLAVIAALVQLVWGNMAIRSGRMTSAQVALVASAFVASLVIGAVLFGEGLQVGAAGSVAGLVGLGVAAVGVAGLARSPSLLALSEVAAAEEMPT